MRIITDITVDMKPAGFPAFVEELCRRECDMRALRFVERHAGGDRYEISIAAPSMKNFEEFLAVLSAAGDRFRVIAVANAAEKLAEGGLLVTRGKAPIENIGDFQTRVIGAAELVQARITAGDGFRYTGISRSVGFIGAVRSGGEGGVQESLRLYAQAERDAVILGRFGGLNGVPLVVRMMHPEDIVSVLQRIQHSFAAIRIQEISEADLHLYDLLVSGLEVPVLSRTLDEIPLYLMTLLVRIILKNRLAVAETTVGFVGITTSVVRMTRLLSGIGCYRVLGSDPSEKAMLALEDQGGLATTSENIFSNADITVIMKSNFDPAEYRLIRPGQFIISLIDREELDIETIRGKGARELILGDLTSLGALFPGVLRGAIEKGLHGIDDDRMVQLARKLVPAVDDQFRLPDVFSGIHEQVYKIMTDAPSPRTGVSS